MGVVCCDDLPKLAHEDDGINLGYDQSLASAAGATASTGATSSVATLPSDHTANDSRMTPKSSPVGDEATQGTFTKSVNHKARQTKKRVRINDEVTLIPLLTSASFFRKTPKPTTITSSGYCGIMPSFRIVTPAAITTDLQDGSSDSDDDLVPKATLWWTKEERREILQANQRTSRDFKRFQPRKLRRANLVYNDIVTDCCCRTESQDNPEQHDENDIYDFFQRQHRNARNAAKNTSTTSTGACTSSSPLSTKKRKRSEFAPTAVNDDGNADLAPPSMPDATIDLPTNVRGLEWGVLPDAKRYRKSHVRTVLGWQERFRRMNAQRRRRRHGHDLDEDFEDEEWSSSSSSSSSSDDDDDDERRFERNPKTCETSRQQYLMLGQKASISSLRSCMLARVLGRSDEIAAHPVETTASELEKHRVSSGSPTPSLAGTTDESESSDGSDGSDEDDSDGDESDSDTENEHGRSARPANPSGYYPAPLFPRNSESHRRMFRPRMMPPMGWR